MARRLFVLLLSLVCVVSLLATPLTALATEISETEPVVTEPVMTEPMVTEAPATEPTVIEPEVTEPVVTEPEVTEPVVTEPEVTEPEVTEPEVTEPEVTEPEVTEPEVTEPEVTEPEVTEPEVTEPEVTEPEVTEPEVTEPEVTEPEVTEPEVTEPEVTEPEVTEPEVTEPEVTEPEVTEPEVTEPEEETEENETLESGTTGFVQNEDGTWSYYRDDVKVTSKVIYVDGYYYGFNGSGIMYEDTTFRVRNEATNTYAYHRAKSNGTLYVNEWYQPYADSEYENDRLIRYYYGDYGMAPSGMQTVDGQLYYFSYQGQMLRNTTTTINNVQYIVAKDGTVTTISGTNWYYVDEYYYYSVNGVLCADGVYKIGNNYYGFNYNGRMYEGDDFWSYYRDGDENTEDLYGNFRAKEDGKLYVNEWYQPYPDSDYEGNRLIYYYYGEHGLAAKGVRTVGGNQYYFDDYGQMMRNTYTTVDGRVYIVDNKGIAHTLVEGWNQLDEKYYYVQNGELYVYGVYKIGSSYYGFNSSGVMYNNTSFSSYYRDGDENTEDLYGYFRAKEDGKLYVNEWYQPYPDSEYESDRKVWYYYGEHGIAVSGLQTVGGKLYYFSYQGQMLRNRVVSVDGQAYIVDAEGNVITAANGWNEIDGNHYYAQDGVLYTSGVYKIGNNYYGFNSSGVMYNNTSFSTYYKDGENEPYGRFRAKEGGALYVNEWYFPNPEGNPNYKFYYGEHGMAAEGLQTVGGKLYYFDYDGEMLRNRAVNVDGQIYILTEDGSVITTVEGWNQVEGKYYYVKDGSMYSGDVYKIGNNYYGFDHSGVMYDDTTFYMHNDNLGRYGYHRAKEGGALYVNEWCQPYADSGNEEERMIWYYYGDYGMALSGQQTVGGKQYYFSNNGEMQRNCLITMDGKAYVVDANGNLSEARDGWTKINDKYYYAVDGELYTDGVYKIGNNYYGFNYRGVMYEDTSFWTYYRSGEDEYGEYGYFRAKEDGTLYVNAWYQPYPDSDYESNRRIWYYYGEHGIAVSGLQTVGGTQYYFYGDGQMMVNGAVTLEDGIYAAGGNGILVKINDNGWTATSDGDYYYAVNGELYTNGIYQINGVSYGFNYRGRMYNDELFSIWNEEEGRSYYYYAKPGGALCVNAWAQPYKNDSDYGEWRRERWYYFGANGIAARGITTIGGVTYYFDYDGEMLTDTTAVEQHEDGSKTSYIVNEKGVATRLANNTWTLIDGKYYYAIDGEICRSGVYLINGAYYGFNYSGQMYVNTTFWMWDDEADTDFQYRAKANGVLYRNEWYKSYSYYYYYGNDAKRVSNQLLNIGGLNYYFDSYGEMATNTVTMYNGQAYLIATNGVATKCADGWMRHPANNEWLYVKNGAFANGLCDIGGTTYAFEGWRMVTNGTVNVDGKYYATNASGVVIKQVGWHKQQGRYVYVKSSTGELAEGWFQDGGAWYYMWPSMAANEIILDYETGVYYVANNSGVCTAIVRDGLFHANYDQTVYMKNGKIVKDSWQQVNGSWYYFDEEGFARRNGNWGIDDAMYLFDQDGKMQTGGWTNLWGSTYYAYSNGKLATGITTIDGIKYAFYEGGPLMEGGTVEADGKTYLVSGKGVVLGEITGKGWVSFGGKYYYVDSYGDLYTSGSYKIKDKYYSFDYDGVMRTNEVYGDRFYGASGAAITGWQYHDGSWYYADSDYRLCGYGIYTINGSDYYFDGYRMRIGKFLMWTSETERTLIVTDKNGVITGSTPYNDGWLYVNGSAYYYQNGQAYTGWVGDYYVYDGYMRRNGIYEIDGAYYCLDKTGKCIKGQWYQPEWWGEGYYLLARPNGKLYYNEWYQENGIWYYFSGWSMAWGGIYEIDGEYHEFDKNGKWLGQTEIETVDTSNLNGWQKIWGEWYYIHAGEPVAGEQYIDGKWYHFVWHEEWEPDSEYYTVVGGPMITSAFAYSYGTIYYYGADGARANYAGWQKFGNNWVYFNENNSLRHGWIQDGTNRYYQSWYYDHSWYNTDFVQPILYTGYHVIDGELYYFNNSGVCQGTRGVENGWYNADGVYYYFVDGELIEDGYHQIDGAGYYFSDGQMMTHYFAYVNGYQRYFGANGKMVTTKGWVNNSVLKCYIGDYGEVYNGIYYVNGKYQVYEVEYKD